jgi:DNA topoisomerase IB
MLVCTVCKELITLNKKNREGNADLLAEHKAYCPTTQISRSVGILTALVQFNLFFFARNFCWNINFV